MPITSLIVRTEKGKTQSVSESLGQLPGVEVTDVKGDCLVVVTETSRPRDDRLLWKQMEVVPGVAALDIIYHNFEDVEVTHESGNESTAVY